MDAIRNPPLIIKFSRYGDRDASQLSWFIPISEALMLPVFLYWFYLQIKGKTVFPRWMAFTNVLGIFALLKGISLLMPVSAFRLGFTNGLMSESMVIWFGIILFSGADINEVHR